MAKANDERERWLVAVWPGMGSVALLAGSYLLQNLPVRQVAEVDPREFFDIQSVELKNGIATIRPLPRSILFEWQDPRGHNDLLIFAGEAQPARDGYALCQRIIDYAIKRHVKRVFTFAAMATQLHLGTPPRVFAAATDLQTLAQVKSLGVEVLAEGQISGLNGVLLGAGAERGLQGACLLGEMPYFAVNVPNPRAALVVLECFTELAGIKLDFSELSRQADAVEQNLQQLLQQMMRAAQAAQNAEGMESLEPVAQQELEDEPQQPASPRLDRSTQRKIDALFDKARQDRSKAVELKQELDRLGVFKQYEDRFLDLFRKAE